MANYRSLLIIVGVVAFCALVTSIEEEEEKVPLSPEDPLEERQLLPPPPGVTSAQYNIINSIRQQLLALFRRPTAYYPYAPGSSPPLPGVDQQQAALLQQLQQLQQQQQQQQFQAAQATAINPSPPVVTAPIPPQGTNPNLAVVQQSGQPQASYFSVQGGTNSFDLSGTAPVNPNNPQQTEQQLTSSLPEQPPTPPKPQQFQSNPNPIQLAQIIGAKPETTKEPQAVITHIIQKPVVGTIFRTQTITVTSEKIAPTVVG